MEYQYHIFSPYRVCPLGAHVDHQHGLVTGFAINKGVDLWFNVRDDNMVNLSSRSFDGDVSFEISKPSQVREFHWGELNILCHVRTIGAVFDFFAGTAERAPRWWQEHSLEWLYRLIKEPKRMWRRYVLGNPLFLWNVFREGVRS